LQLLGAPFSSLSVPLSSPLSPASTPNDSRL
jgi:hypothetical protein